MCDCDSVCFCVKCSSKPTPVLEDWAKIKAYREATPSSAMSDEYILTNWRSMASAIGALARRIQRDDTPPPSVPQDVLIWREAKARYLESIGLSRVTVADYRNGLRDAQYNETRISGCGIRISGCEVTREAIKLALEGFGKEVT